MKETVSIIMATYNGAKYIAQQIDSILAQSYNEWKLYIRDDGSTDNTIDIINEYVQKHQDKICLVQDDYVCKSAYKNFMRLLTYVDSEYVMFCDQDDVWMSNKIEMSLAEMKRQENIGDDVPIALFTDYEIVDGELNLIRDTSSLDVDISLNSLLTQNCTIGAVMMINRKLVECAKEWDYLEHGMHDWLCMLIAAYSGHIGRVKEAAMLYRQHGNNVLGENLNFFAYVSNRLNIKETKKRIDVYFKQAELLMDKYTAYDQSRYNVVKDFFDIRKSFKLVRGYKLIKGKYLHGGMVKNIGMFFLV